MNERQRAAAEAMQQLAERERQATPYLLYLIRANGSSQEGKFPTFKEATEAAENKFREQQARGGYTPYFAGVEIQEIQANHTLRTVFKLMFDNPNDQGNVRVITG